MCRIISWRFHFTNRYVILHIPGFGNICVLPQSTSLIALFRLGAASVATVAV